MTLALAPSTRTTIVYDPSYADQSFNDYDWLNYFDPQAALNHVVAHIMTLQSSRTPEKHTLKNYESGLRYALAWLAGCDLAHVADHPITYYAGLPLRLPDEQVMTQFIGHLSAKGLAPSTIANKYQIPFRHWIKYLRKQTITGIDPAVRDDIDEYRRAMGDAIEVKAPQAVKSSVGDLYRHGVRLTMLQINDLLASVAADESLSGLRDLAYIYTGITSALRVAEMGRITLSSIKPMDGGYTVTVRGKRGKIDPVAMDEQAYALIMDYVSAWNAALEPGDPRTIGQDTPIWQPTRAGRPEGIGVNGYLSQKDKDGKLINTGISRNAMRDIVMRRAQEAIHLKVTPHDLRRSYAHNAMKANVPILVISKHLRHESVGTTQKYIGDPYDMADALLSNRVNIIVPKRGR